MRNHIANLYSLKEQAQSQSSFLQSQVKALTEMVQGLRGRVDDIVSFMPLSIWDYASCEPRQMALYLQEKQLNIYLNELLMFMKGQSPLSSPPQDDSL